MSIYSTCEVTSRSSVRSALGVARGCLKREERIRKRGHGK